MKLTALMFVAAVFGGACSAHLASDSDSRMRESDALVIRDERGVVRCKLDVDKHGAAGLTLYRENGTVSARLSAARLLSPELSMFDSTGVERIGVRLSASDHPHLELADAKGRLAAHITVGGFGFPSLRLTDNRKDPPGSELILGSSLPQLWSQSPTAITFVADGEIKLQLPGK